MTLSLPSTLIWVMVRTSLGTTALYRLTRKANHWAWGSEEEAAFHRLKQVLSRIG